MAQDTQEQQAKDLLDRIEIRTMKKDLKALREGDALKEREKIKNIQPQKIEEQIIAQNVPVQETAIRKSANEERAAENGLKVYATEEERQRIFFLESERSSAESELATFAKEKGPELQQEKAKLLAVKDTSQKKLEQIIQSQTKLEGEAKFLSEEAQKTTNETQKQNFQKAASEFDDQIKSIEKQRWAIEKDIQEAETKITDIDRMLKQDVESNNNLRTKIASTDSELRNIYASIIERVEKEKEAQKQQKPSPEDASRKLKEAQLAQITREREEIKELNLFKNKELLNKIPSPYLGDLGKTSIDEEKQREKFLQDVSEATQNTQDKNQQNNNIVQK